jgi:hypothetical protein
MGIKSKKGIQDVILYLILSGIAVAMIFIGILLAYQQIACYAGVDWAKHVSLGPNAASFQKLKIDLTVDRIDYNLSQCNRSCCMDVDLANNVCRLNPDTGKENYNDGCLAECAKHYAKDKEYSIWTLKAKYNGAIPSNILFSMNETRIHNFPSHAPVTMTDMVATGRTDSEISLGATKLFTVTKEKQFNCKSIMNISVDTAGTDIGAPVSGVASALWGESYDFCISKPEADVNVTVYKPILDNVQGDEHIRVNVSITGSEVEARCPNATIHFIGTTTNNESIPLKCDGIIDSRRTPWAEGWSFRTRFVVVNDLGDTKLRGKDGLEAATVYLDFTPSVIGFDHNMSSCANEIKITNSTSNVSIVRNVTDEVFGYNAKGQPRCYGANVTFPVNVTSGSQTFFAYIQLNVEPLKEFTDSRYIEAQIAVYYPHFNFTDFTNGKFINTDFIGGLVLNKSACGVAPLPCCTDLKCQSNHACNTSKSPPTCYKCGDADDPCCPNSVCYGSYTCVNKVCKHCGKANEPCCANSKCDVGNSCLSGTCKPCGKWCSKSCEGGHCFDVLGHYAGKCNSASINQCIYGNEAVPTKKYDDSCWDGCQDPGGMTCTPGCNTNCDKCPAK